MIDVPFIDHLSPDVRNAIIRILLAILALAVVWVLRSVLSRLIIGPIRILLSRNEHLKHGEFLVDALDLPVQFLVMALGLTIAAAILDIDYQTSNFITDLSRTFVILAFFAAAYRGVNVIVNSSLRLQRMTGIEIDQQLIPFIRTALRVILIALVVVVILQEWNYDVNGLVAGFGLGGLAFSLAAQDTVANLFAFSTIVTDRPFVVGEFIKTSDVEGIVDSIGSRTTRVRRLDQAYVTIPNKKLGESPIVNWSRLTKRRLEFTLGVSYGTSSSQMKVLVSRLYDMLTSHEKANPESVLVRFINFGDSSLDVLLIAEFYEPNFNLFRGVIEEVNLNIMEIVEELGLSIAFPSRSLYIENMTMGNMQQARLNGDAQEALPEEQSAPLPMEQLHTAQTDGASEAHDAGDSQR